MAGLREGLAWSLPNCNPVRKVEIVSQEKERRGSFTKGHTKYANENTDTMEGRLAMLTSLFFLGGRKEVSQRVRGGSVKREKKRGGRQAARFSKRHLESPKICSPQKL